MVLDVKDTEDQNLIRLFPRWDLLDIYTMLANTLIRWNSARDFIYQAVRQGGQVLVHCNGTNIYSIAS